MTAGSSSGEPLPHGALALLAGLSELEESDRIRYLRAYLEYVLDRMRANEEDHFGFLADCAMLAAENVQDIRIEHLELRFDALVNPPPKPWGEVFTDVAMTLALQAGILIGWQAAMAGFLSVLAWGMVRKSTLSALLATEAARFNKGGAFAHLDTARRERQALEDVAFGRVNMRAYRGGWWVPSRVGGESSIPLRAIEKVSPPYPGTGKVYATVNANYVREVDQRILFWQNETASTSQHLAKAVDTYEKAFQDAALAAKGAKKGWGDTWDKVLNGAWGGVSVGTTQTAVTAANAALDSGSNSGDAVNAIAKPFLASEVVGRYLDWISDERMLVAEAYASMRMMLHASSDHDVLEGDDFLKFLLMIGTEQLSDWKNLRLYRNAARPIIAKGMEAAIWYEYLSANGILLPPEKVSWRSGASHQPNEVVDAYYILSKGKESPRTLGDPAIFVMPRRDGSVPSTTPPPMYAHEALLFKRADKMPELLVGALFKRYAEPYYATSENAAKLMPFVYVADAYANVKVPPEDGFWGYPAPQELRRISEMRFIVIRYFTDVIGAGSGTSTGIKSLIPAGTDPAFLSALEALGFTSEVADSSFAYWLSGQMECSDDSDPQTRADADTSIMVEAEQHFRMLSETAGNGSTGRLALNIQEALFGYALTDLNQDIQAYQLMKTGALELDATGDTRTIEDLKNEIFSEQGQILEDYQALLDAADDDRELRSALENRYQSAVDAAQRWEPGMDWVWYGPTQSQPDDPFGESLP